MKNSNETTQNQSKGQDNSGQSQRPIPKDVTELPTKSAKIRALHEANWPKGDIARSLQISYQFVYNVLKRPLKRKIKEEREAARAKAKEERNNG